MPLDKVQKHYVDSFPDKTTKELSKILKVDTAVIERYRKRQSVTSGDFADGKVSEQEEMPEVNKETATKRESLFRKMVKGERGVFVMTQGAAQLSDEARAKNTSNNSSKNSKDFIHHPLDEQLESD